MPIGMNYEADRILDTYLLFHYGTREQILAGAALGEAGEVSLGDACFRFPVATVVETFDLAPAPWPRALDLGCAVGRSTFELTRYADEVVGIDFSQSFIDAANHLATGESLTYRRYAESHLADELEASAPAEARTDRVRFEVGDAMDLRPDLGAFDLVHAANLLCRLPEPGLLLERLPALVKPGGQLVLATPATWLEEFTPASNQPPGPTLDHLDARLSGHFDRVSVRELPFFIREHVRKYQLSTSQTSLWVRRG